MCRPILGESKTVVQFSRGRVTPVKEEPRFLEAAAGGAGVLLVMLGEEDGCRASRSCASSPSKVPLMPLCDQCDNVSVAHWQGGDAGCENAHACWECRVPALGVALT